MEEMTDAQIISDIVRLVNKGLSATIPVKGNSMRPFILGGRDRVVLTRPGEIHPGDVVLAQIEGHRYVLHRVMEVAADRIVLMGDGNLRGREVCRPDAVLARAVEVIVADGRSWRFDTPRHRRAARLWRRLLPVRRWLLAIYKRICLRNTPTS